MPWKLAWISMDLHGCLGAPPNLGTFLVLGRPRGLRYTATTLPRKTRMAVPRCRGTHDCTYRATACFMALPRIGLAWSGFHLAPTTVHLPRYRIFRAPTTAQPSCAVYRVPRYRGRAVALPRATSHIVNLQNVGSHCRPLLFGVRSRIGCPRLVGPWARGSWARLVGP